MDRILFASDLGNTGNIFNLVLALLVIAVAFVWLIFPFIVMSEFKRQHQAMERLNRNTEAALLAIQTLNDNLLAYGQSMERHLAALHSPSPPRGEEWGLPDIAPRATAGEESGQRIEILD